MEFNRVEIRRIMLAVNRIDGLYAQAARRMGLKENTLSLLYALDDGAPHTQKQICEEWLIPKTTINTVVKECVANGYVTLAPGEHSHEKLICLTERGKGYAQAVLTQVYSVEQRAMLNTAELHSPDFVDAIERFSSQLKSGFEQCFMERKDNETNHKDGP